MCPAPVYAPPPVSARCLEGVRDVPLRDLEDVEAAMLRGTASSLIEPALTWGSARAQCHGYQLEARREAGEAQTQVSLCIHHGAHLVAQAQVALAQAG